MITKKGMIVFVLICLGLITMSGLMSCKKEVERLDQSKILGNWTPLMNTEVTLTYTTDSIKWEYNGFTGGNPYEWISDSTFFCNNASFKVLSITDNNMLMIDGVDTIEYIR